MRKFEYKEPRVHAGELRTPITFYKYIPKTGPEPGEEEKEILLNSWAKIDEVWMKDIELAKQNDTASDLTLTIRDPFPNYHPRNEDYISINHPLYADDRYNIKHVQVDFNSAKFIKVIAGLVK